MDIDKIAMLRTIKNKYHVQNYGLRIKAKTTDPGGDDRLGFAKKLWIRRDVN